MGMSGGPNLLLGNEERIGGVKVGVPSELSASENEGSVFMLANGSIDSEGEGGVDKGKGGEAKDEARTVDGPRDRGVEARGSRGGEHLKEEVLLRIVEVQLLRKPRCGFQIDRCHTCTVGQMRPYVVLDSCL